MENFLSNQSFLGWQSCSLCLWSWWMIHQFHWKEILDSGHSWILGFKQLAQTFIDHCNKTSTGNSHIVTSLLCILWYQNDSNVVLFFVSGKWSIQVCDAKEINRKSVDKNKIDRLINPLHPNISMQILHTVPFTFLKDLKRRICLTIKSSLVVDHFLYSHDLNARFRADIVRRN